MKPDDLVQNPHLLDVIELLLKIVSCQRIPVNCKEFMLECEWQHVYSLNVSWRALPVGLSLTIFVFDASQSDRKHDVAPR